MSPYSPGIIAFSNNVFKVSAMNEAIETKVPTH